jgi:hypothetical protein
MKTTEPLYHTGLNPTEAYEFFFTYQKENKIYYLTDLWRSNKGQIELDNCFNNLLQML